MLTLWKTEYIKLDPGEPGFKGHPIEFMMILFVFLLAYWTILVHIGPY